MLELPEALRQDSGAHARQAGGKICEPLRSCKQLANQEEGPPVTDCVQGKSDGAELPILPAALRPSNHLLGFTFRRHYFDFEMLLPQVEGAGVEPGRVSARLAAWIIRA